MHLIYQDLAFGVFLDVLFLRMQEIVVLRRCYLMDSSHDLS